MMRKLMRALLALGLLMLVGAPVKTPVLLADDEDKTKRPPQTLEQGFEKREHLLRDAERAAAAPLHSAWIVESSRFTGVPFGSFMPDRSEERRVGKECRSRWSPYH